MLTEFSSYHRRKRQKQKDICAKMRAAKERKRMERTAPEYPKDPAGDYRVIHIEDRRGDVTEENIIMLEPAGANGRCDQVRAWVNAEFAGVMGWDAITRLLRGRYPMRRNRPC